MEAQRAQTMALFPADRPVEIDAESVVRIRLKEVELRRPRQWGGVLVGLSAVRGVGSG